MARVRASSRLHFGLLSLPSPDDPARHFGGAGLMIQQPGLEVRVEPAAAWSASGSLAERALACARTMADSLPGPCGPFAIQVAQAPPEHVGLGTGTQLALAVAHALTIALGQNIEVSELARRLGRGRRSGIGVHGFQRGGFLVDGGKGPRTTLAPLLARHDFPPAWRILLAIPGHRGLHGPEEREVFAHPMGSPSRTDALCRLLLLGVLPSLAEQDLPAFGQSLAEFNRKVGEMFAAWQGGPFAGTWTTEMVELLNRKGLAAGQSSWGPTAFAIGERDRVEAIAREMEESPIARGTQVLVTSGDNQGALVY